jgi:hypothetical protein
MRAREFITESRSLLNEVMMTNAQWMKEKYVDSFVDGLDNEQVYAFEFPKGNRFEGIIQNPDLVKQAVGDAVADWNQKDFAAAKIRFSVAEVDEDGNLTGQIIENVPINSIFKDEKIKGELKPNMGNISEALLGCAVAAKFASGGKPVTEQQLVAMGKQIARNKGYIETTAGKDKLVFKVSIPFMDKKAFYAWLNEDSRGRSLQDYNVPAESIALIERRARTAIEYANTSKRVQAAIQEAANDPEQNKVDVISDGGEKENQSSTKVDLKILIDGKEAAKRLLSIKAGNVAQFGQVTGANFEHISEFFNAVGVTVPTTLKKYFYDIRPGTRDTADQKEHNFNNGVSSAFSAAFKQLKSRAATDQANLVEDVYQGLLHHLTRHEEGVEMVILDPDDKKAFKELDFGPAFYQALKQLQLVVTESDRESSYNISIYGFPVGSVAKKYLPGRKDSNSKLVDLTSQLKDGSIRNMLGMGSLLKNIADIENHIEQQGIAPAANAKAPVAQPKVAQPKVAQPKQPALAVSKPKMGSTVQPKGTLGATPLPQTGINPTV